MRILILGGFLGSGKTSLLMGLAHFLAREAKEQEPPRVIILENEAGAQGVDDALLRSRGFEVENLFAGCACCTVGTELIQSISYIEEKYAPDWMILETTGLAYPGLIRDNLFAALNKTCRICTVVDAQRFTRIFKPMEALLKGQISCADIVLINKIDLVDEHTIQKCEDMVRQMNEKAVCCRSCAADAGQDEIWEQILGGDAV